MANFPLATKQDSKKFGVELEDVGIRSDMEGGYVLSRPRHTRRPRRTWKTGFTDLGAADKATIETFWNDHGTYKGFNYTIPFSEEVVNVRFKQRFVFEFAGWPENERWNINDMVLEEV